VFAFRHYFTEYDEEPI